MVFVYGISFLEFVILRWSFYKNNCGIWGYNIISMLRQNNYIVVFLWIMQLFFGFAVIRWQRLLFIRLFVCVLFMGFQFRSFLTNGYIRQMLLTLHYRINKSIFLEFVVGNYKLAALRFYGSFISIIWNIVM